MRIERKDIPTLSSYEILKKMHEQRQKSDTSVVSSIDFITHIAPLYEAMYLFFGREKIFVDTKSTHARVCSMNADSLLKSRIGLGMLLGTDYELGCLIEPNFKYMISASYLICDGGLMMLVHVQEKIAGYAYFFPDLDRMEIVPYSLISMMEFNSYPDNNSVREVMRDHVRSINEDFAGADTLPAGFFTRKKAQSKKLKCAPMIKEHWEKYDVILHMLKYLIFLRTSEVYSKEFVPDSTPTFRRKKDFNPLNYIRVDSTWDMNIDVNSPFPVRGHFVNQACKIDGKWGHKLIYVETYMKSGYHRKAKKILENYEKQ